MANAKKEAFTPDEQQLAAWAKALAHPARIAILKELAKTKDCICGQIVQVLPLAQSTVSQHLKELKEANLINGTIDGVRSCYCINWETIEKLTHDLGFLIGNLRTEYKKACC